MGITSLDIRNSLSTNRTKIINILDFDSKKLIIIRTKKNKIDVYCDHNPFFLSIDNLKGYFEHYDDKNNVVGRVKDKNNIFFFFFFFNCYLADPQPFLGHSQGDSLTNPMLITAFLANLTRRSPGAS